METKLALLILLGPVAALYDFCTNPAAPPQIFVAQFEEAFGHAPGANLPPIVKPHVIKFKRVYVTRQ